MYTHRTHGMFNIKRVRHCDYILYSILQNPLFFWVLYSSLMLWVERHCSYDWLQGHLCSTGDLRLTNRSTCSLVLPVRGVEHQGLRSWRQEGQLKGSWYALSPPGRFGLSRSPADWGSSALLSDSPAGIARQCEGPPLSSGSLTAGPDQCKHTHRHSKLCKKDMLLPYYNVSLITKNLYPYKLMCSEVDYPNACFPSKCGMIEHLLLPMLGIGCTIYRGPIVFSFYGDC